MFYRIYKSVSFVVVLLVLLCSCATGRLTPSNFAKIKEGMTKEDVINILGEPLDINSANFGNIGGIGDILGVDFLSGSKMTWRSYSGTATVVFFKDKVKYSNFSSY